MRPETSPDGATIRLSFQLMTLDMVSSILTRADNPGAIARYVTTEVRELSGARTVLLFQCQDERDKRPRLLDVSPERRRSVADAPAMEELLGKIMEDVSTVAILKGGSDAGPLGGPLHALGAGPSIAVPLRIGSAKVGVLLLLDIPSPTHSEGLLDSLSLLSTLVALALRHSFLFENQEAIIAQRTRQLEQSERAFRSVALLSPVGVFRADPRGEWVFVNTRWCEIAGLEAERALGSGWMEALDPEDRPTAESKWREFLKAGGQFTWECRFRRSDGTLRWTLAQATEERDAEGNVTGYIGAFTDLSERKKAEEERLRLEAHMQHTEKLKSLGVLAGGIAHDFNNLLTGIMGNAELALSDPSLPEGLRDMVADIEQSARRAAELARQMLAYSGKGRFVISRVNLNEMIEELGSSLLRAVISKKARLRMELAPDLDLMECDATQIRQVAMNLITNASEAIGEREGVITVRTAGLVCDESFRHEGYLAEPLERGSYVSLEVSDTGCGMPEEVRARIFEPFFTTKFSGRGLGLSAVLGIIRGHHGAIRVQSEVGSGTTFRVLLPALPRDSAASSPAAAPPARPAEWHGSGTVLLADDEDAVRRVTARMLALIGFRVLEARDGLEAVSVFRENAAKVVCVLMDLTMPHLNGEEASRAIRSIRKDVPILLVSGYGGHQVESRFVGHGLAGTIQKPFTIQLLREKLQSALENREAGGSAGP